jgi:heat shock protein 4
MDEIRALAGPVVQRHFEKVEAEKAANGGKDEEMTDADAPKVEIEEAGDP